MSSTTHPIFEIQEVVAEILSWMEPYQTVQTARVNRTWFFASVSYLWNSVLLSIALSPLGNFKLCHGAYRFVEPLKEEQRVRFRIYSKHVRILQGSSSETPLLRTAIARFRADNIQNLFPNLHSLRWEIIEALDDINTLISPSMEYFALEVPNLSASSFQPICHHLSSRIRVLRFLQIHILSNSETDLECTRLFHQLLEAFETTLTWIQFPGTFYNEETIERLRRIPNLCQLNIETPTQMWVEEIPLSWTLSDGKGNFDVLKRLSFGGSQWDICDIFLNRFTFSTLVELTWNSCTEFEDADSFVAIIVHSCPQLGSLTVGQSQTYLHDSERKLPMGVHWSTIRPLLGCKNLSALSLHCCGVWMTHSNLIELLTSRQASSPWKVLEIYHAIPLRMSDLSIYAEHCPELEHLGVHVDGYVFDYILPPSDHPANDDGFDDDLIELHPLPRRKFSKLAVLNFAFSQFHWKTAFRVSSIILGISEIPTVAEGWEWPYWEDVSTYVASRWWSGERGEMTGFNNSRRSSMSIDGTGQSEAGEARAPVFW